MVTNLVRIAILFLLLGVGGCWYELHRIRRRINATAHTVRILAQHTPERRRGE